MIPNISRVVRQFQQSVTFIQLTKTKDDDFKEIIERKERSQLAVVQPADKDKLNSDTIDWSLSYFTVHSVEPFYNAEILFYDNKYFKIIDVQDFSDYVYTTGTAEEIKDLGSIGL